MADHLSDDEVRRRCVEKANSIPNEDQVKRPCKECSTEFVAHRNSRAAFCCPCAVDRRRDYLRKRLGTGSDPLPGFPRAHKFETRAEIEAYFSPDKIDCLLCGRRFRSLNHHLRKMHGTNVDEYRRQYGLPLTEGLVGAALKQNLVERGEMLWELGDKEAMVERIIKGREKYLASGKRPDQKVCDAFDRERSVRMHSVKGLSPLSGENKDTTPTIANCTKCGAEVPTEARVAITHRCRLLCKKCRYENWKVSKEKWFAKNPGKQAEWSKRYHEKKAAR